MRSQSHKTFIGLLREHVSAWRKSRGWSRESAVQEIVQAHVAIDGPFTTGISFEPTTRDHFEIMKVNADRVFRWLDDEGKDTNLLPVNFLPSLLAALPSEVLHPLLDDLLRPLGLGVRPLACGEASTTTMDVTGILRIVLKEGGEAEQALLDLVSTATPEKLTCALKELSESIQAQTDARAVIEAQLLQKSDHVA